MHQRSSAKARLRSLVEVFDSFHRALEPEADPLAQKLCANWASVRGNYGEASSVGTPSQLSAGLEQGLRKLPAFFYSMGVTAKHVAVTALAGALREHFPSFLAEQEERLAKVMARGKIRGEREFYLVRSAIDQAEGQAHQTAQLATLYALVERFESRARRVA